MLAWCEVHGRQGGQEGDGESQVPCDTERNEVDAEEGGVVILGLRLNLLSDTEAAGPANTLVLLSW